MSKIMLIAGLVFSSALHIWLMGLPEIKTENNSAPAMPVPNVQSAAEVEIYNPPKVQDQKVTAKPEPKTEPQPQQVKKQKHQADFSKAEKLSSENKTTGDFAGSNDGKASAMLRINWGSPYSAAQILNKSGMKLIVLKPDTTIASEMRWSADGVWQRDYFVPQPDVKYSQALRVVDKVDAFSGAASHAKLKDGERLAVLLPEKVENMLRISAANAASENGLNPNDVLTFAGRFQSSPTGVDFIITHIQPRAKQ